MSCWKLVRRISRIIPLVILVCFTGITEGFVVSMNLTMELPKDLKKAKSSVTLSYGSLCHVQTPDIHSETISVIEKAGQLDNDASCKLSQRLECVPVGFWRNYVHGHLEGRCGCLRALSQRAIFLTPTRGQGNLRPGCYIPAGFASSSTCGHSIALPFGMKQTLLNRTKPGDVNVTLRWISHTSIGNTRKMCVPNSECRTSSKYIGTRCVCHPRAIWNRNNGTCTMENESSSRATIASSLLVILIHQVFGITMAYT